LLVAKSVEQISLCPVPGSAGIGGPFGRGVVVRLGRVFGGGDLLGNGPWIAG
jgi:hypothetical protein